MRKKKLTLGVRWSRPSCGYVKRLNERYGVMWHEGAWVSRRCNYILEGILIFWGSPVGQPHPDPS
ncbi:hypothetical protein Hanom_Chr06g00487861 [Helianthus anomalus]